MKNHYGFALIFILLFLSLFSILGLYEIEVAIDKLKTSNNHLTRVVSQAKFATLLQSLENKVSNPDCHIPLTTMDNITKTPLSWWQQYACSGNLAGIRYYYVFEQLPNKACLRVKNNVSNQLITADFYRLTLLVPGQTSMLLQSTIMEECDDGMGKKPVRQMMRELVWRKGA